MAIQGTTMIPKALYEALPYGYLAMGLFALVGVNNVIGKCCGVLLMVIGVVIHQARARYRAEERMARRAAARDPHSGRPGATSGTDPISRYPRRNVARRAQQGFILLVPTIAVAIGVLAAIAIPAYQDYSIRFRVDECVRELNACRLSVLDYWVATDQWPADIGQAGCERGPSRYCKGITNTVASIMIVVDGAAVGMGAHSDCVLALWSEQATTTCPQRYVPAAFHG